MAIPGGAKDTAPANSRRRWLLVVGIGVAVALAVGTVLALRLNSLRSRPAESATTEVSAETRRIYDAIERQMAGDIGEPVTGPPAVSVTVDELLDAYDANEFSAAAKFESEQPRRGQCLEGSIADQECRVIAVTGTVRGFGRSERQIPYVDLERPAKQRFYSISAYFEKAQESRLASVQKNQQQTVHCLVVFQSNPRKLYLTRCGLAEPKG